MVAFDELWRGKERNDEHVAKAHINLLLSAECRNSRLAMLGQNCCLHAGSNNSKRTSLTDFDFPRATTNQSLPHVVGAAQMVIDSSEVFPAHSHTT